MNEEVSQRIAQAQQAMHRLGKIWRTREMGLEQKIRIFKSMVSSILMYALEAHALTFTQVQRLEAAHTRMLRRIARSPSHLEKEHNSTLRQRLKVHSVDSSLTHARLRFLKKALLAQSDNLTVLSVLFGKSEIDGMVQPSSYTSKRLKIITQDLTTLHNSLETESRPETPWLSSADVISATSLAWFSELENSIIKLVLTHHSKSERSSNVKATVPNEPTHCCQTCTARFDTTGKLATHRWQAHGVRHQLRQLVLGEVCPAYSKRYKNLRTAQEHFQTVCGPRMPPAFIEVLTRTVATARAEAENLGRGREQAASSSSAAPPPGASTNIRLRLVRGPAPTRKT